jgi:hypothetical protein
LENKTAWVRLVSSVNTPEQSDQTYFRGLGVDIKDQTSLAKEFVLFGGTSKYLNKNSYKTRSGISNVTPNLPKDGQYGILGEKEINKYGYRPMPGITSVNIETQGRLGSIRAATVSFKCWDKFQLDIIDALYFKLGYTAFLEWGHTFYYDSKSETLKSTELYSIDPFDTNLSKEEISRRVAKNNRETEGNYDGMLGMITNFNFSYNQEGGYDCTVKMIGLGVLAESIKINNSGIYIELLKELQEEYDSVISDIQITKISESIKSGKAIDLSQVTGENLISALIKYDINTQKYYHGQYKYELKESTFIYPYDQTKGFLNKYYIPQNADVYVGQVNTIKEGVEGIRNLVVLRKFNKVITFTDEFSESSKVQLDFERLKTVLNLQKINLRDREGWIGTGSRRFGVNQSDFTSRVDFSSNGRPYRIEVETDNDLKATFLELAVSQEKLNEIFGREVKKEIVTVANSYNTIYFDVFEEEQLQKNLNVIIDALSDQLTSENYFTLQVENKDLNAPGFAANQNRPTFTVKIDIILEQEALVNAEYLRSLFSNTFVPAKYSLPVYISFTDSSLIKSLKIGDQESVNPEENEQNLKDQDQVEIPETEDQDQQQNPSPEQTEDPYTTSSNLELILRAIQLRTQSESEQLKLQNNLNKVQKIALWDTNNLGETAFYKRIFSFGIFSDFVSDLVNDNVNTAGYDTSQNEYDKFKVNAKYGFATNLLTGYSKLENFQPVNFKDLLNSYVILYNENSPTDEGVNVNYPTYISLGHLLMILNSSCTLYDDSKDVKRPVIYIDFNPNHNFCLSNPQQLSLDPWTTMIPFQGEEDDYREIFQPDILTRDESTGTVYIKTPGTGSFNSELFSPFPVTENNGDVVSGVIPPFKYDNDTSATSSYRGKVMNILLNLDYLINTVKNSAVNDGENKVFLKQFIEKILVDVNKSLGNINFLRLSYNDQANCLQIVDDQIVPATGNETQLQRFTAASDCELPLLGKSTIAKSLEIKTEVTTRLASMIAISANANAAKNAGGTDGQNFGFINYKYTDRYIPNRTIITVTEGDKEKSNEVDTSGNINAAIQFNQAVKAIYGVFELSKTQVEASTNYYLERMTDVKSTNENTRASAMIPVSLNMKTDGISGLAMGHAFKIPEELIPYTYSNTRILPYTSGVLNKVGFVIVGLNHTIESNVWDTSLRATMIFLKDNALIKSKPVTNYPVQDSKVEAIINIPSLGTYTKNQIEKAVKSKGYVWYENAVNIVGVRNSSDVDQFVKLSRVTNAFDDKILLIFKQAGSWKIYQWEATTDPGLKAALQVGLQYKDPETGRIKIKSPQGLAVMKPGQYADAYSFGRHKEKYPALEQTGNVTVYRDTQRDAFFQKSKEQTGVFGINIHKAGADSTYVENWSEGCQVFKREDDFNLFLSLLEKSKQNRFTYTLIESKDIA